MLWGLSSTLAFKLFKISHMRHFQCDATYICEDLAGPAEIAQPSFAARSGFLGSLLYWLSVHHFQVLSPLEGKAVIVSMLIVHGVLVDLFRYCMSPCISLC